MFEAVTQARAAAMSAQGPGAGRAGRRRAERSARQAVRSRRGLPAAARDRELPAVAGRADEHRGSDRRCSPHLQRQRAELQHEHPDLPRRRCSPACSASRSASSSRSTRRPTATSPVVSFGGLVRTAGRPGRSGRPRGTRRRRRRPRRPERARLRPEAGPPRPRARRDAPRARRAAPRVARRATAARSPGCRS